jgi:hypothetical protein
MREKLLIDVPHRQVLFTIPKMLRVFFKYNRSLLSDLCLCGKEALLKSGKKAIILPIHQSLMMKSHLCPPKAGPR